MEWRGTTQHHKHTKNGCFKQNPPGLGFESNTRWEFLPQMALTWVMAEKVVNVAPQSCFYYFNITGPTQSPGTHIKWWECPCSALPFWSERGWDSVPLSNFHPPPAPESSWLLSVAGIIARLQLHVCWLPVPARQTVWCHVRHGRQGHSVWTPRGHLQVLAYVEGKGLYFSILC